MDQSCNDTILVTGGSGFIGSNFVLQWMKEETASLINLDLLTYAGNLENLASVANLAAYRFVQADICDGARVRALLEEHRPRAVVHFAAESHVDRSIVDPGVFLQTNVFGTYQLLEAARQYWQQLAAQDMTSFRFLHVSTDEVYGSLEPYDAPFSEQSPYAPNSPYAASKASSDHLVRAYHHTYGLPVLTTNCSNNYGPFQFPEKLIPLMILNALSEQPLPVYGDGGNVRDWLFVEEHCSALRSVLAAGHVGEVYNIGGASERTNLQVVTAICDLLDEVAPVAHSRRKLITYVPDRPGHDRRYAVDTRKIQHEIGWQPAITFEEGLRRTIAWYLEHLDWVSHVRTGAYLEWVKTNYSERMTG